MLRKLLVGLAATLTVLAGFGDTVTPASADHDGLPTVCVVAGSASLPGGVNVTPPSPGGGYTFSGTTVCVGSHNSFFGPFHSSGGYSGSDGSFSGSYAGTCSGSVSGTRVGVVLVGNANGNCGSGPLVAVFVPTSTTNDSCGPRVDEAAIVGVVVFT